MRSGKGGDVGLEGGDQHWIKEEDLDPDIGVESADLGINLDALDNSKLRRVSRSKWGGVHMLRTGKRSSLGNSQGWSWDLLRSLSSTGGRGRRGGRRSWFGGGHMLRSGKRSSWTPREHDDYDDDNENEEEFDVE